MSISQSVKIEKGNYTVESLSIKSMKKDSWISWCQGISENSFKIQTSPSYTTTTSPYSTPPRKYEKVAQDSTPEDTPCNRSQKRKPSHSKRLEASSTIDMPSILPRSHGTSHHHERSIKGNTTTTKLTNHLLEYLIIHPDATVRFYDSNMRLNINSGASYLSVKNTRSTAAGNFFLGTLLKDKKPIFLKGAFHTLYIILPFVTVSTAEAEVGTSFLNIKEGVFLPYLRSNRSPTATDACPLQQ